MCTCDHLNGAPCPRHREQRERIDAAFRVLVRDNYRQRQMDELERAALAVERGNALLDDLPPEGTWQS